MSTSTISHRSLIVAFLFAAFVLVAPEFAWAQLPNFSGATQQAQNALTPLISFVQWVIGGLCLLGGMWEAFKASRGNSRGWITALLLWFVGAIVFLPGPILNLFGLTGLASALSNYGLGR